MTTSPQPIPKTAREPLPYSCRDATTMPYTKATVSKLANSNGAASLRNSSTSPDINSREGLLPEAKPQKRTGHSRLKARHRAVIEALEKEKSARKRAEAEADDLLNYCEEMLALVQPWVESIGDSLYRHRTAEGGVRLSAQQYVEVKKTISSAQRGVATLQDALREEE